MCRGLGVGTRVGCSEAARTCAPEGCSACIAPEWHADAAWSVHAHCMGRAGCLDTPYGGQHPPSTPAHGARKGVFLSCQDCTSATAVGAQVADNGGPDDSSRPVTDSGCSSAAWGTGYCVMCLKFPAPLMNFIFPEDSFSDVGGWVGGSARAGQGPSPPPPPHPRVTEQ